MKTKNILFCSQKGGVGKSFLADEFAFELDRQGKPYNIYDIDKQGGLFHETKEMKNAVISIADMPGRLDEGMIELIKTADVLVIPTRASSRDLEPFMRTMGIIEKNKRKKSEVYIVLNGWNRFTTNSEFLKWVENNYKYPIFKVSQSEMVNQSAMNEKSIIDYAPKCKVSGELRELFDNILK